jgi:hypothetical protein
MRAMALLAAILLLPSPVAAQGQKAAAESLTDFFANTCLKYAPAVERIVTWKDTWNLEAVGDQPFEFFELVYDLSVMNGEAVTFQGQTKSGLGVEVHLNIYSQDGQQFYGCTVGSPSVTSAALETAFRAKFGLPGDPIIDEVYPTLHHRMWNFGSSDDPQYFILLGNSDPNIPTAMVANFGRR